MQTKDATSPSQSVKPGEIYEPARLTLCFGVYLVKDFAVFLNNFVAYTLLIMADSGNKIVHL
jgi:hypothetical protein